MNYFDIIFNDLGHLSLLLSVVMIERYLIARLFIKVRKEKPNILLPDGVSG